MLGFSDEEEEIATVEVGLEVRKKDWALMGRILVFGWDGVVGACRTGIGLFGRKGDVVYGVGC